MSDNCIICAKLPERDHWALRQIIDSLPLQEEQVCDEYLRAFWQRLLRPPKVPTKH